MQPEADIHDAHRREGFIAAKIAPSVGSMPHLMAVMAVTSPGSFLALSCRRVDASHRRTVRSAEPENRCWWRSEPSGGGGANATAVTLPSNTHSAWFHDRNKRASSEDWATRVTTALF